MTPFTAAGATQALEDAGALLALFTDLSTRTQLSERMEMFDEVRVARATRVQLCACMPLKGGSPNPPHEIARGLEIKDKDFPVRLRGRGLQDDERGLHDYGFVNITLFTSGVS